MTESSISTLPKLKPILDRVFVKPIKPDETSKGGIILSAVSGPKPQMGKVLALGPGRRHEKTGKLIPMSVKAGDTVIFAEHYAGHEVNFEGEKCYMIDDGFILGVVE